MCMQVYVCAVCGYLRVGGWVEGLCACLCVSAYVHMCVCTYIFSGKFSAGNIWIIYMEILYYNENIIMQILAI